MPDTPTHDKTEQTQRYAHVRRGRFNARITDEQKRLFERAAALYGQSVSQFVMSSAQRAAEAAIREHEIITLTARDSHAVMEALLHPAEPGSALKRAVERYNKLVSEQ
jgi:uncharacterized protein (DUF1778 family)